MAYSLDLRRSAVNRYLESDESYENVSKIFGIGRVTLQNWVKREQAGQGLEKISQSGRPRKFTLEQREFLLELTQQHSDWTQERYSVELNDKFPRLNCNRANVFRTLKRLGLSFKKKSGDRNNKTVNEFKD